MCVSLRPKNTGFLIEAGYEPRFEDSFDLAIFVDRPSMFVGACVSPQSNGPSAYAAGEIVLEAVLHIRLISG